MFQYSKYYWHTKARSLTSIPGGGDQVAIHTIVAQMDLQSSKMEEILGLPRRCSPPFPSIQNKSKIKETKYPTGPIKSLIPLFHMGRSSAIKMKGEFLIILKEKVAEGKNKWDGIQLRYGPK